MGISVTAITITDDEIRQATPKDAADRFIGCINFDGEDCCHLHDLWKPLDRLLTGEADGDLPLGAIRQGDVNLSSAEGPTHAIYSATATALAEALDALSEEELRARYDGDESFRTGPGGRPISPAFRDEGFSELIAYLRRFGKVAARARDTGKGLLFHRYEDF